VGTKHEWSAKGELEYIIELKQAIEENRYLHRLRFFMKDFQKDEVGYC